MTALFIDYETYSACELKDYGLDNYSKHPTTGVHCMAFCFDDGPIGIFIHETNDFHLGVEKFRPDPVMVHVSNGGIVYAHNAAFELAIWNNVCVPKYGWPQLKPEQMRCTMAMAYAMSLPGALEKAAPALGIEQQKDMAGARVMMQLAKPKNVADALCGMPQFWTPEEAPEKFAKLYAYCKQDVEVERELAKRLMPLSDYEQKIWELDYAINQRGVQIDLSTIEAAIRLVDSEKARLDKEMLKVTGGVVGKCSEVQLLVKWIRSQGVELPGVAKADVLDAIKGGGLPPPVIAVLKLRQEAAKSSTAKLVAMKNLAGPDGRVRNMHQYHGASTGRWAGRGIQPQNFPRGSLSPQEVEQVVAITKAHPPGEAGMLLDMAYGPPLDVLSSCLRGMITAAPGKTLIAADFSAIEARVLAWLAGEEKVLDIFRTHGKIYEHAAAGIYRKAIEDVTKSERQIGKVAVLALGYQGGVGAFQSMARVYGVNVGDDIADEIKSAWREAHPKIVRYWYALEDAATAALEGGTHTAGAPGREVLFKKSGSFLWCRLPSGRCLCYPYPRLAPKETPWGATKEVIHFMNVNGTTRKWEETSTYGGSLAENITQAVARDILADAMVRLESRGYPVVMHVHDEAVVEVATPCEDSTLNDVESVMAETPSWAAGLPLSAEGWINFRYKK